MNTRRIFLKCDLTSGAFSGEAVFRVENISSCKYEGIAPIRDCRNADGAALTRGQLPIADEWIAGKLVTRLISNGGAVARVALPDGEAVEVAVGLISERESEISHVPV